jgi:hypothetical protein
VTLFWSDREGHAGIKQVRVSGAGMSRLALRGAAEGICASCEDEQEQIISGRGPAPRARAAGQKGGPRSGMSVSPITGSSSVGLGVELETVIPASYWTCGCPSTS